MVENLTIACVKWGKRFNVCYVNILYEMVRRHLPADYPFNFMCFTDDPIGLHPAISPHLLPDGVIGWWNKLYLFKEGIFKAGQRVLYFDLDTLITGSLEDIVNYQGAFALLQDFYRPEGYGSGVMLWEGGTCHQLWSSYEAAARPILAGGDQEWIEKTYPKADILQNLFPGAFASYKADCNPFPPEGTRVVCFHGDPKQDDCNAQWVRDIWKIGGAKSILSRASYKTVDEQRLDHIRHAMTLSHPWLDRAPAHEGHAVLIGGGPSLNQYAEEIRLHRQQGHILFAINNASAWLKEHSIGFDAHVMLHGREEHTTFVPANETIGHYYASTCHPAIFEKAVGNVIIWHPLVFGIADLLKDDDRPKVLLEGCTAGMNAIRLAYALGYRQLHLYGFDSCYGDEGEHHAYSQPDNDIDRIFDVTMADHNFSASAWMIAQAKEFVKLAGEMVKGGCMFTVNGDGLLPFMAAQMAQSLAAADALA